MMFPMQGNQPDDKLWVDDVFSTYLYTGNGSMQTIDNGIDLAGKGGMVWIKSRSTTDSNSLFDTVRGATKILYSDLTNSESTEPSSVTAFNSSGFNLGATVQTNRSGAAFTSRTFRKAPKFFDVVTWTGDGTSNRQISHSLQSAPGFIVTKRTDGTSNWRCYHSAIGANNAIYLDTTSAVNGEPSFPVNPTAAVFYVQASTNVSGATYVAYLFAHDPSADGIIKCGSFTTDASGNATVNTIGWEPQWGMFKASSGTGDWIMLDTMRGWDMTANDAKLAANTNAAEVTTTEYGNPTATGFEFKGGSASTTYTYTVIRRPNKPPTSGTQAYKAIARTGTGAAYPVTGAGFAPDLFLSGDRSTGNAPSVFVDKLRGVNKELAGWSTNAEYAATGSVTNFENNGVTLGTNSDSLGVNVSGRNYINHLFRRAPGFMDMVCAKGTGGAQLLSHNLGVVPELIFAKSRDLTGNVRNWMVGATVFDSLMNRVGILNSDVAFFNNNSYFNGVHTATTFCVDVNLSTTDAPYVFYLFASLPGISKVGSYTGNGSSQTINCGFTTGARFILIKRTDSTGDWYIWDSARGIVAANDPHLSLNTTAAEVTTDDSVDPNNSGFIVNQNTATNINVNAATYIFLAIA